MAFDKDKFWAHVREPIANLLYAGKMKKELKNKDFTILSCNCAAGIIYHRYDHPFLSPTINLWIEQNEFLKFVSNWIIIWNRNYILSMQEWVIR